jgi:trypsin
LDFLLYSSVLKVKIRAGSADSLSGGSLYTTTLYKIHPKYESATFDYDVAVVKTTQAMTLDGITTRIVTLAAAGSTVAPGTDLLVSGWGHTSVSCKMILIVFIQVYKQW